MSGRATRRTEGAARAWPCVLLALALAACLGAWPGAALADDEDDATQTQEASDSDADSADASDDGSGSVVALDDEDADSAEDSDAQEQTLDSEALDADDNEVDVTQLPDSSFIYDTSIVDLSTADTYYDGQTVQVVGEVVGDAVKADLGATYYWVTLQSDDGLATVSVYMNSEAASKIDTFGSYAATGTTLQVRGTFNLSCDEHDGATDLHAEVVTVTARGASNADAFEWTDFLPGAVLVAAGLLMMLLFFLLRERQR